MALFLAGAVRAAPAQERVKRHRIAVVIPAGPVATIDDKGVRGWQAFWDELRRSGEVEGQNLIVERYSAEGRHTGYGDLAREIVSSNPEVIIALTDAVAQAVRAVTGTTPIVWIGGDPMLACLATSLARPAGNVTGVTVYAGTEIFGKRLQLLKDHRDSQSSACFVKLLLDTRGGARRQPSDLGRGRDGFRMVSFTGIADSVFRAEVKAS